MKRLFKGATIVTCNDNFDIITNGMVATWNDTIEYVGAYDLEYEKSFNPDALIYAKNKILMPGFVNAHTHLPMTLFRGYGCDLPLKEWLEEKIWPAEAKLTAKDCEIGAKIGLMEMMLSGTTSFLDMYFHMDTVADTIIDAGMRSVLTNGMIVYDNQNIDAEAQKSLDLYKSYQNRANERIKVMMSIHAEYTNTKKSMLRCIENAKELNCGINIHVAETQREVNDCIQRTGMTPIAYLNSLGVFDVHTVAAHCVVVDDNDIQILRDKNVHVVHNPSSNLKLASGFSPVAKMLETGVNVSIGTDGASSNNNLDMFKEMHIVALLAKGVSNDPTVVDAKVAIKMATINGAKALGIDNLVGSLELGKRADMIMINQHNPFFLPKREVCNNIVYSGSRREVEMTMVDGRIIMERGNIKTIECEDVYYEFEDSVARLTS